MDQAFKYDPTACGIDVRTGTDGTWITLTTKKGSAASFQPITTFAPKSDSDMVARIVREWCEERVAEAAA